MKKNFPNVRIIYTLRQVDGGTSVTEVCRKTGITAGRAKPEERVGSAAPWKRRCGRSCGLKASSRRTTRPSGA